MGEELALARGSILQSIVAGSCSGKGLRELVLLHPQSRTEPQMIQCWRSAQCLHVSTAWNPCLGNGAAHSGHFFPRKQDKPPQTHPEAHLLGDSNYHQIDNQQ